MKSFFLGRFTVVLVGLHTVGGPTLHWLYNVYTYICTKIYTYIPISSRPFKNKGFENEHRVSDRIFKNNGLIVKTSGFGHILYKPPQIFQWGVLRGIDDDKIILLVSPTRTYLHHISFFPTCEKKERVHVETRSKPVLKPYFTRSNPLF